MAHGRPRWPQRLALPLGRSNSGAQWSIVFKTPESSPTPTGTRGTIVEITSPTKSEGWFMHAVTGEEWLLKLKFRVAKNTFSREPLAAQLALKPLNDLPDLPVYGTGPRVKCKNLRGPFQEVQVQVHSLDEVDKPAFWKFVDAAIAGFNKFTERVRQKPEDVMPWKVLGQKWHFARKGFPPGKPPQWDVDVLEVLCERLQAGRAKGSVLVEQPAVGPRVRARPERALGHDLTRSVRASVDLVLTGPSGRFALGRIRELGTDPQFNAGAERDSLRLRFESHEDLDRGDLNAFLSEHLASLRTRQKVFSG